MKVINPYLNFNGNTEEAFKFYRSVFGGEFAMVMRMKDAQGMPVPEGSGRKDHAHCTASEQRPGADGQ